ncbi:MAG: DUF4369 domain-containing protein [Alloprevotella sp.]|nr:DUF4369 domain-containing protein [Alloprevotella sp.]
MKRWRQFTSLCSLLILCGCAGQYNIAGNSSVPVLDGNMLYLTVKTDADGKTDIDSCKVVHGSFRFNGDIDSVCIARVYMGNESILPVVLENGNLTITVDNISQRVSGSPLNERLYDFYKKQNRLETKMWRLQQRAIRQVREGHSMADVEKKFTKQAMKIQADAEELETEFLKKNAGNVLGPGYFQMVCEQYAVPTVTDRMARMLEQLPPEFFEHPFVRSYLRRASYNPFSYPVRIPQKTAK